MSRNGQQKKCFDRKGICHLDFEKQPEKPPKVKSGRSSTIKAEKACQFKQRLRILLELPVADQQQKEILKNAGLPARYQDHLQLIAWNLYQKALSGDMAAIRELRGILEEGGPAEGRGRKQLANPSKTTPVVIIDDVR